MLIDRTHRAWGIVTLLLALAAGLAYHQVFHSGPPRHLHESVGGTPLGLAFGILSLAIFIFAALLGWRRKHPSWRLGRLQFWMKGHIWLTFLTVPLVFLHAGFKFGGPLTAALMWVFIAVMASGVFGLALQHILPRVMLDRLPHEVVFEQIPFLRSQLVERAQAIRGQIGKDEPAKAPAPAAAAPATAPAASAEEAAPAPEGPAYPSALARALDEIILPYLEAERGDRLMLHDEKSAEDLIVVTRLQVDGAWHPLVDELKALIDERRSLDIQTRLQHWLHGWILFHAPFSFLLLILAVWHAVIALVAY